MRLTFRRDIQALIFQQTKDQPNQFSGSKSECAIMLELVDLKKFEVVVTPELGVASSHRVGGFRQAVMEKTVAGLDEEGMLRHKIAGLVLSPDKAGILSDGGLGVKAEEIANFSDDTGGVDFANSGNGRQQLFAAAFRRIFRSLRRALLSAALFGCILVWALVRDYCIYTVKFSYPFLLLPDAESKPAAVFGFCPYEHHSLY